MPSKQSEVEQKRLQNIKNAFRKARDIYNKFYDQAVNAQTKYDNMETKTNLGYFRESGTRDRYDEEEYEKLAFEESLRLDVKNKYDDFIKTFNDLTKSYDKVIQKQIEKVEREEASEDQEKLIEDAKKEGGELNLDPISVEVNGLAESKKEYTDLVNTLSNLTKEIQILDDEKAIQKKIDEHMQQYKKDHPIEKEEPQKEEKVEEAKKEEPKKEEKEPENEAKKKEEETRKKDADSIENLTDKAIAKEGIGSDLTKKMDSLFDTYVGKYVNDTNKKYKFPGFDKEVTFKEGYDKFIETTKKNREDRIDYDRNARFEKDSEIAERNLQQGINAVKDRVPNIKDVRVRADHFSKISDYQTNEVQYSLDYHTTPDKYCELVGITNSLAKLHHQNEKPGFFSRLFNTKYNKQYNAEQGLIDYYKDMLIGGGKIDKDYVDKITDKETCYQEIDRNELLENFYKGHRKNNSKSSMFPDKENEKNYAGYQAKMSIIKEAFNGKDPSNLMNDFFKDQENKKEENKKDKENSKEKEPVNKDREKIEIEELAPEKQGLDKQEVNENSKQPELSMEAPSNSK